MNENEIKENYKRVFDNIHASDELKNKILMQKAPQKRKVVPVIAAISSVAAALVIFTAVKDYDFKQDTSGVISEMSVTTQEKAETGNDTKDERESEMPEEVPVYDGERQTDKKAAKQTAEPTKTPVLTAPSVNTETSRIQEVTPVPTAATPVPTEEINEPVPTENSDNLTSDSNIESESDTAERKRSYRGILLNINSPSVMPSADTAVVAEIYESAENEEYTTEEWDNNRYFSYIGTDILNSVEMSGDLIYTGGASSYFTIDSSGTPLNDTRIFTFSGNNGRFVQIVTSRDLTYANTVLSADGIVLSDINGINAAVFAQDNDYIVYIICNGTSYIINTALITEDEICTILATLTD